MKLLKDPGNTRVCKDVPLPPQIPLSSRTIFKDNGYIDWMYLKKFIQKQGRIYQSDFQRLIKIATSIFKQESNLIYIQNPVTIVGDIHGQLYDLLNILTPEIGGNPAKTKYLFLGDYVDRGNFSVQVLILLISLKISLSKSFFMLRGNHQCRQLASYFNFRDQCLFKYNQKIYDLIMEMFDCLPLACLIDQKFLCVHGGISHYIKNLDDIKRLDRFREIPKSGLFCDLVWSDPIDPSDFRQQDKASFDNTIFDSLVYPNTKRRCSYYFGQQLCNKFLEHNNLISIIRAHQVQLQGFKMYKWGGLGKFPQVVTVFSVPNYCDYYANKGAIVKFQNNNLTIKQYNKKQHPFILPKFLDLFSWSIPFLIQKVTEIFYHMIKPNRTQQVQAQLPVWLMDKKKMIELLLQKSKQQSMENISLVKLDGNCPDNKLLETKQYLQSKFDSFEQKKKIDVRNQSRPH